MRIAQIYHDFRQRGGAERHVQALSAGLADHGHEVTIVSNTPPAGFRGFVTQFAHSTALSSALRLGLWMRRERIQLVHAHSRISALVATLAVLIHRIPVVVTSHILPDGLHLVSRWGDATICVSDAVRRRLIARYRLPSHRAIVIHNGVELEPPAAAGLFFGPQPVISMAARFARGKGHEILLETATRLLASGFPGTFVLAGDGPLESALHAQYASDRIIFLGQREDVPAIFAASTVSVVCSESEAFPYVILESLGVGTPVISTDCGGPAEVIRHGRNGFLFPAGDSESLRRLLLAVADGTGFAPRREIGDECRRDFSRRRMVDATLSVYRELSAEVGS